MLRHLVESGNNEVSESDLQITEKRSHHHTRRRKISEALFIKNNKPSLNKQDKSIPLQLFNWGMQLFCRFSFNNHLA